jgi:DNA-binding transcriptional ArsR family regulator
MEVVDIFHALGDPTRLEIVERLAHGKIYNISRLSKNLPISRQAIRKHIQILADAKIISLEPKGRDTEIHLLRDTLDQGKSFITHLELQWDKHLNALRDFVELGNINKK